MGGGDGGARPSGSGAGGGGSGSGGGGISSAEEETRNGEVQKKLTDYIQDEGVNRLRNIIKIYDPTLGKIIAIAEFVYENRKELSEAYTEIVDTWQSDQSLEDKIADTAGTVINTTAKIVKKKTIEYVSRAVASTVSSAAIESLEDKEIFDKIDSSLHIPGAGDKFKELLQDSIEKETEKAVSDIAGEVL